MPSTVYYTLMLHSPNCTRCPYHHVAGTPLLNCILTSCKVLGSTKSPGCRLHLLLHSDLCCPAPRMGATNGSWRRYGETGDWQKQQQEWQGGSGPDQRPGDCSLTLWGPHTAHRQPVERPCSKTYINPQVLSKNKSYSPYATLLGYACNL